MKKAENEAALMEYSSSEKWQLFARYFEQDWHAGFNLVPEHAGDNSLLKIPLVFATIMHLMNFGIFTSLIPALCQTGAALIGRRPLLEKDFDEARKILANLQGENLEKICEALADLKPDSQGSKKLVADLNALSGEIRRTKEAILHDRLETDQKLEKNPGIAGLRLKQKELISSYFNSRGNIGTQTQRLIADLLLKFNIIEENEARGIENSNPFSNCYYD